MNGGGIEYTFFKAQGGTIGTSICEDDRMPLALEILAKAKAKGVNIHLPVDNIITTEFSNTTERKNCESMSIPDGWMGLDIGEATRAKFAAVIESSKTILWNGPMGVCEMENYQAEPKAYLWAITHANVKSTFC